jgi:hypothetical protein
MRLRRVLGSAAVAGLLLAGTATSASAATTDRSFFHLPGIQKLRAATDQFHRLKAATDAGYGELQDINGIACITDDMGMGAMGIHYANGGLVGDGKITPLEPEALLYAPDKNGTLHLAGAEYVVLKADWRKHHTGRPSLYGHRFNFTPAGNRFGLPDFYSLHVWAWKANPSGMFHMFNPTVHCPA